MLPARDHDGPVSTSRRTSSHESFEIRRADFDSDDARYAIRSYTEELVERFPAGFDTGKAAAPEPGDFSPPHGGFLLLRAGGHVRGCGAVRTDGPGVAEIRRMWVHPEMRGRGAGRALLDALEELAIDLGHERIRLDTAAELTEAGALYRSAGYVEIPAYNDNPYAAHWFEKLLT